MRNRNNRIVFYLTDNELLSLQNKIAKTGLSREAYIRKIIRDITPKELPNADFNSVLYQLRMIGNNIHQIAMAIQDACDASIAIGLRAIKDFFKNLF